MIDPAEALIAELRLRYPEHIVARCTNGYVGRWRSQRYLTGRGSATTGRGTVVYRKILLAVYPPDCQLPPR